MESVNLEDEHKPSESLEHREQSISSQKYYVSLKAKVKQTRKETRQLGSNLKQLANSCMQISEENKFLLDELKQICKPNVIAMLEAKNPDKNLQK